MSTPEGNQDAPSTPEGEAAPLKPKRASATEESLGEEGDDSDSGELTRSGSKVRKRDSADRVQFSHVDLQELGDGEAKSDLSDKGSVHSSDSGSMPDIFDMMKRGEMIMPAGGAAGSKHNIRRSSLSAGHAQAHVMEPEKMTTSHPRRRVSAAYESWTYNEVESQNFLREQSQMNAKAIKRQAQMRWLVNFLIGLYVAFIAVLVWLLIKYISMGKFLAIFKVVEHCETFACTIPGLILWIAFNVFFTFVGAYLVTFHAPSAAGSGIPQVKCYLNGIRMPGLMSVRTLLAKAGGVVLSVTGGLACGKEGPMIHSGAICASGISSGQFSCCGKFCMPNCCDGLRSDDERRDFVAAGAASGVSAAFASPVGGVLFALEEGASFVKQELTWRMLFSSMIAGLALNFMMSCIKGHPSDMSSPGLISFGYLGDIEYRTYELPIFLVMGLIGGLIGALFVAINYKITIFRRKNVTKPWLKVFEACFVAAVSGGLLFALIYAIPDCQPIAHHGGEVTPHSLPGPVADDINPPSSSILSTLGNAPAAGHSQHKRSAPAPADDHGAEAEVGHHSAEVTAHGNSTEHHYQYGMTDHGFVFRGLCKYGESSRMAEILFGTPEQGLHSMLHAPLDNWSMGPLFVMVVLYHLLTTWTYGLNVSSGLFIPSLLIGAVWGRMVGMIVMQFIPGAGTNISKYVLVGAAAQLGGFVRMTISLTIIVIECTGDITFGIPIILTLIMAKWMGDFFNPGIYDLHIEIWGAPLLGWDPPAMSYNVPAKEVMSTPVMCLRMTEDSDRIQHILDDDDSHNGYPVVDDYDPDDNNLLSFGRLKGFILKSQLYDIMDERDEEKVDPESKVSLKDHMTLAPFSVQEDVPLPRIFKLFRSIGLRHLVVVNDRNRVVGIITRLNLARFRGEMVKGKFHVEELEVADA